MAEQSPESFDNGAGSQVHAVRPDKFSVAAGADNCYPVDGQTLGHTQSICPICKRVVEAHLSVADGKGLLTRTCSEHGEFAGGASTAGRV